MSLLTQSPLWCEQNFPRTAFAASMGQRFGNLIKGIFSFNRYIQHAIHEIIGHFCIHGFNFRTG